MDHEILVAEMTHIEKLPTQDRLKLARQRRADQLRRWFDKEKKHSAGRERGKRVSVLEGDKAIPGVTQRSRQIQFVPCVILLEAAARNDIAEVRRLLSSGVNPDSTNDDELTALHQCCIDDSEEMMKLLLEFGANVNAEDCEKWTPLHAAATCGHLHLVKYLIAKGANLLAVNADGNMPYDICEDDTTLAYIESEMAKRGVTQELIDETRSATEEQMLKELKQHATCGGDLEWRDSHGATPLHISAANGYMRVATYLLEDHHVSTEVVDEDEWQPIHAAACWGHIDVLELLVENGADLNARTRNGETPFDLCEDIEMKERIIQLRTEQETKRIQKRHVMRRMSSNRHRTNSVKRVSVKEKQQTSWKEAKQEADLRKQFEEQLQPKIRSLEAIDQSLDLDDINLEVCPLKDPGHSSDLQRDNSPVDVVDDRNRQLHNNNNIHNVNGNPNVQMDIHVTVTVSANPGTLPDLKKHRARSRPPSQNSLVLSATNLTVATHGSSQSLNKLNDGVCYDTPPSPTSSPKKFISDPSEVVGPSGKFRCCALM